MYGWGEGAVEADMAGEVRGGNRGVQVWKKRGKQTNGWCRASNTITAVPAAFEDEPRRRLFRKLPAALLTFVSGTLDTSGDRGGRRRERGRWWRCRSLYSDTPVLIERAQKRAYELE